MACLGDTAALIACVDISWAVYSALYHVAFWRHKVDELVPFLSDTGCGRSSLVRKAHDPEVQTFQTSDSDCAERTTCPLDFARKPARTKWKQGFYLSELRILAAELHSLQNALLSIESKMDCLRDEKEIVTTGLDDQLKMVVCYCEEFCARADQFMGNTSGLCGVGCTNVSAMKWLDKSARTQRSCPWLSGFYPIRKLRQSIISNVTQREISNLQWKLAIEKQDNTIDASGQRLMQLALSIRDRGRVALPDKDLPHEICDLPDVLCFLFSTLICPSLTWLSLQSLDLKSASALDQSILTRLPFSTTCITILGYHRGIALTIVASSIIVSTGATVLPVWKSCMRGRLSAYVSSWLLIAVGLLVWSPTGGSIDALFLVFMPFALGFGVASGLLWHKRMSNAR